MANDETKDDVHLKDAGRRALLKAATVAGGAVAASALLPGSWKKPVATVGGLPAHAQTSQTITLTDSRAGYKHWPVLPPTDNRAAAVPDPDIGVYCRYEDTLGDFDLTHQVTFRVTLLANGSASADNACGQQFTYTLRDLIDNFAGGLEGGKSEGRLWFPVYGGCFPPDKITFTIHKGAAHVSNQVTISVESGGG